MKTLDQQIASVEREIEMRRRAYPKFIAANKMTPERAEFQLDCMLEVLHTLVQLRTEREELPLGEGKHYRGGYK